MNQAIICHQVIMYKLLKIWGYEGLMEHYIRLRHFYKERRDVISTLAHKHLNGERTVACNRR